MSRKRGLTLRRNQQPPKQRHASIKQAGIDAGRNRALTVVNVDVRTDSDRFDSGMSSALRRTER
jgi:hypothetical protein